MLETDYTTPETAPQAAFVANAKLIKEVASSEKVRHATYKTAVDHAEEMGVHLYGTTPDKLLKRVRPREDPDITAYRLESYEPTTKSTAGKALSITNKIFNPNLFAIKFETNDKAQKLAKYSQEEYPVFNSVVTYLSHLGLKKAMADPNAIFLIEPKRYDLPVTEMISPIITCIKSCDIHYISEEFVLIFKSETDEVNGVKGKFYYYQYIDKSTIYNLLIYTTNMKEWFINEESKYVHDTEGKEFPFWHLGGEYSDKYIGLFESYFYPAVPFWNKAITAESDLDGAFIAHLHPQKWEITDECEYVEDKLYPCDGGYIFNSATGNKHRCPGCGGSGRKSVKSPHQVYQVSKDKIGDPEGNSLGVPAGYIDVPVAATQMLVERVALLLGKGLEALAMDIVNEIGENQSGVAKELDRSELFDFLGKVRDLFYDRHLKNIFYFFAKYMFIGVSKEDRAKNIEPMVVKPSEFDIFSTQELTEQLKTAKEANINPAYLQTKQLRVQNKEFQQEPDVLLWLNLVVKLDPLAETNSTDVDLMVLRGSVSKVTAIIHDNVRQFVTRALLEDKKFAEKDYTEQMEVLTTYAEEVEEENKVKIDQSAIEPDPTKPPANAAAGVV